jgi:hypothetical protein
MIPYAELEFAIVRWKARAGGAPLPAQPAASGTVEAEVPVSTSPDSPGEAESGTVSNETGDVISGTLEINE